MSYPHAAVASRALNPSIGVQIAMGELSQLIDELEPTLSPGQSRLLHRIRLAAESLGSIRAMEIVQPRLP